MVSGRIKQYEEHMKLITSVTNSIYEQYNTTYLYVIDTIIFDNKCMVVDLVSELVKNKEGKVHPLSGAPALLGTIAGVGFYNETFKFQIMTKHKLKIVYNWKRFILDE